MSKALMVDVEYCTGCHACEVACQVLHGFPAEKLGIELKQIGPTPLDEGDKRWQYDFFPVPTAFCDGCAAEVAKGKRPTCVHHCQTQCLVFGDALELAGDMQGKKMLFGIDA